MPDSETEAEPEHWRLRYDKAKGRVFIVARGYATGPGSEVAAQQFIELLGSKQVDLVVDLERMTGYTSEARRVWQECFYPVRGQLHHMYVLGRALPQLIRMGVTVVAAHSGLRVRFFADLSALDATTK